MEPLMDENVEIHYNATNVGSGSRKLSGYDTPVSFLVRFFLIEKMNDSNSG